MRLINSSFEILEQGPGLQGIYKQIELAGRTCYKSLDKITEDSAEGFVNRMIASKHYAMLEHGTVYLKCKEWDNWPLRHYENNPYSKYVEFCVEWENDFSGLYEAYVTTNLRVLVENNWLDDLKYICEPTEFHKKRVTVRFTTDRGVSHEFVRHRVFSFAQESTRYCNYSKDKFGNELTFILPSWIDFVDKENAEWMLGQQTTIDENNEVIRKNEEVYYFNKGEEMSPFIDSLSYAELNYFELLENGWTPQQARQVLPNALKTELVMTGFISDWQHFFDLRARGITGAPHPDAKALAEPLMHEFENRNFI